MTRTIEKAAVLGAGVMGSQIAAHLAGQGIPVVLLDVSQELAEEALKRLPKLKPSPVYTQDVLKLITPGSLDTDLHLIKDCDWVIEAVVEKLDIKQQLYRRVVEHWTPGTIVTSNTSGISLKAMTDGLPDEFQKHFLGTHFFNPPRYMKLLEVIPGPQTDPELLQFFKEFGENVLGKGVVFCKDTPNFIANRIGIYGMMVTLQVMQELGLAPDDVDAISGPVMGRPKSATFRTLDVVGLDTFVNVARNVQANVTEQWEKDIFQVPKYLEEMVDRGWLGEKSGQGFFKRVRNEAGEREIHVLDLDTMEYRPRRKPNFASLTAARAMPDLKDRVRALATAKDEAGQFVWNVMKRTLLYSAAKLEEIADDLVAIDEAMRWGFNWEQGPFQTWDTIGVRKSVERMQAEGDEVPQWVLDMLASGRESFYEDDDTGRTLYFNVASKSAEPVAVNERVIDLDRLRADAKNIVKGNRGASIIDIGDDVACLQMHSPKSAIGLDIINLMHWAADELPERFKGLVLAGHGPNFAFGANLALILMEAQDENWQDLNYVVKRFQDAAMKLKYMSRPVVAAPYGMTLGGGVELSYGADRIVAAAETYFGLVETGVGLIPGGGGNKELLIRFLETVPGGGGNIGGATSAAGGAPVDLQPLVNMTFETIAMAKVSTSGPEAKQMRYLRPVDRIVANTDHLVYQAKQEVLALDAAGYTRPEPRLIPALGPDGRAVLELGVYNMRNSGYISDHDVLIAKKLAFVLTGGNVAAGTLVTEQYLLDLEREAFLSLLGERKTQARMQHTLKTGKPLRN